MRLGTRHLKVIFRNTTQYQELRYEKKPPDIYNEFLVLHNQKVGKKHQKSTQKYDPIIIRICIKIFKCIHFDATSVLKNSPNLLLNMSLYQDF